MTPLPLAVFRPFPEARTTEQHVVEEERLTAILDDELLARADRIHDQFPAAPGDTYSHALRMARRA